MSTPSAWTATTPPPGLPPLTEDTDADVVVIGGGIAGVTTAYLAARDGRSVVLLDQDQPGRGMTGNTTAHLTAMQDRPFVELEKKHGREAAIQVGQAHMEAVGLIDHLAEDLEIDCDLTRLEGHLVDTHDRLKGNDLMRELNLLHEIGLDRAEPLSEGATPLFDQGRALRLPDQGRMHALHYLYGLLKGAQEKGVRAYGHTQVNKIEEGAVRTQGGHRITTKATVVATHTPIASKQLALKLSPYATYVIGVPVRKGSVPDALFWDTEDPYHYVRLQPWAEGQDLLIVGGADHRTGEPPKEGYDKGWADLERWTRARVPEMPPPTLRWMGQVFEPADGLPYIGRSPDHPGETYVATGFSGNGTTNGTIAAILISDMLAGRRARWKELYDPNRKKDLFTKEAITHNMGAAKHLVIDHLKRGDPSDASTLKPGEGAVLADGGKHHAVYRHSDGRLERHSATCTHMGCLVHWNAGDKTFDCPCHGSRFATDGHVLSGPAVAPLSPADEQEDKAQEPRKA